MIHGSCLCGAVRLEVQEPLEHAPEACHCTQCRKQTGSYLIAVNVRRTALKVLGEEGYEGPVPSQEYFGFIDDPAVKKRVAASQWFRSVDGALNTIAGYEAMNIIRKGQIRWLAKGDVAGQRRLFIPCSAWLRRTARYHRSPIALARYLQQIRRRTRVKALPTPRVCRGPRGALEHSCIPLNR